MTDDGLTVLYDEACGVCTTIATWLAEHGDRLVIAPIGSDLGDRLLRDLARVERYATVHVVDPAGRRFSGGAAVPVVLRTLRGGCAAAWLADRVPCPTDAAYRALARHRGALSRLARLSAR